MPRVRPADVNALRAWATWVLRAAGVGLTAWGAYLVLKRLVFGIGQGDPMSSLRSYTDTGEGESLSRGVALLVVGGVLGWGSARIARWMVSVAPEGCPGCGYSGPGRDGLCPECGLRLEDPAR